MNADKPTSAPTPKLSHAQLLRAIGEIEGVSLEGDEYAQTVILKINGKSIPIITNRADYPSHHVTREGIRSELSRVFNQPQPSDPCTE